MAVVEAKYMWLGRDGKIHYIGKREFDAVVNSADKIVGTAMRVAVIGAIAPHTVIPVFAAEAVSEGNAVMAGLSPVIKLITDIAEPITYGYMVKGFLKFTQGKEEEAKKTLTNAGIGFLGVQFVPSVMKFLRELDLFV